MEEIEIVYRKISDLTLLDDNPRKISKRFRAFGRFHPHKWFLEAPPYSLI